MSKVKEVIEGMTTEQFIELFTEIENRNVIPFVHVKIKTDSPTEFVLKSKIDGSKNPYWKNIIKESSKSYRLVVNYKERVENNLLKEGKSLDEYIKGSLKGRKHLTKCILQNNDETEYYVMLEYFLNSPIKGETKYFNEGNELDKTILSKWLVYRDTKPENQGLDKTVNPITVKLSNIQQVNVDNKIYRR
jgi:hypothetical protein